VTFDKHDNKLEVMRPHLARQAVTGHSGVAAVGVAQEFQGVDRLRAPDADRGSPVLLHKADRRVTYYSFSLWDTDFGPALVKVCAYFPYPAKIWVNGHEWVKRQAARAVIGLPSCPAGLPPARTRRRCGDL
jgi:hypothetical protein